MRIVLDARSLQDPARGPTTARYLEGLLGAYDERPVPGESFAFLLQSDLDDATTAFEHLDVAGRRFLPPTRLLRSGALTVDPFLLRGASLGAAWRVDRTGAAGAVYHAVGGAPPLLSGMPVVVTLLDLAPWELAGSFQRGAVARLGQQLRRRLMRDAAAVIVGTEAVAWSARRLLHLRAARVHVVPLAPHPAFTASPAGTAEAPRTAEERERLGLPERYFVYFGRFDARHDVGTLLRALAGLAAGARPRGLSSGLPWPPTLLIVGASPADRASLALAAGRAGVANALVYAPAMAPDRLAALVRESRAVVMPAISDSAGLAALDAIGAGVPVVATAVGALPEVVGGAGILVEPRNPDRLAEALRTAWADDRLHARLADAAAGGTGSAARTWADVASDTRRIYAEVGVRR